MARRVEKGTASGHLTHAPLLALGTRAGTQAA
jgi:hypothetical protein